MAKTIILLTVLFLTVSCGTRKLVQDANSDVTYGYTAKNPIKVGGIENGPLNERTYLNSLTGPNGETVVYTRGGSCCAFSTKNSPFGQGLLDMYSVTYEGKKDTVTLYFIMYDKGNRKAPVGFKIKE